MNINPDAPGASTLDAQPALLAQPTPDLLARYEKLLKDPVVADTVLHKTCSITESLILAYEELLRIRKLCKRITELTRGKNRRKRNKEEEQEREPEHIHL